MSKSRAFLAVGICVVIAAAGFGLQWFNHWRDKPAPTPNLSLGLQGSTSTIPFGRGVDTPAHDIALSAQPGETPSAHLRRLHEAAHNGDAQAALDAFNIENPCSLIVMRNPPFPVIATDAQRKLCDGLSPREIAQRFDDIRFAADHGVKGAVVQFFGAGYPGMDETQMLDPNSKDPAFLAWRADVLRYATRDAMAGDPQAMSLMSDIYNGGLIDPPRQPAKALTYWVAMIDILRAQPTLPPGFAPIDPPLLPDGTPHPGAASLVAMQTAYAKELSPADAKAAIQAGHDLFQQCCGKKS